MIFWGCPGKEVGINGDRISRLVIIYLQMGYIEDIDSLILIF